jgi:hypothetical protein
MKEVNKELKVLLNLFNNFLKKIKCEYAEINVGPNAWDSGSHFYCKSEKVPFPLPLYDSLESYYNELDSTYYFESSGGDYEYYNFKFVIDSKMRIITLFGEFTEYVTGEFSSIEEEMSDEIYNYLIDQDCKELELSFDAGGDSGWVHDFGTNLTTGEQITVPEMIQDVCYSLLNNFSGWEVDNGSVGTFTLKTENRTIELSFAYYEEEQNEDELSKAEF